MVEIRMAHEDAERAAVAAFMQEVFPRAKWDARGWAALLAGRWAAPEDPFAVVVRDGTRLVGVLGLIFARRPTERGPQLVINMTSWYVLPDYRGQGLGLQMLQLARSVPGATLTNFSSSSNAVSVVRRAGLEVLDDTRCVWRARPVTSQGWAVQEDPILEGVSGQILSDHAGLPVRRVLVETPDRPLVLVLMAQKKHDAYVTHEVLYVSDAALFSAHARGVADALLPGSAAVLAIDSRFVADPERADAVEPIAVPRFYTAGLLEPQEVDPLYSEIVLLGMKLY